MENYRNENMILKVLIYAVPVLIIFVVAVIMYFWNEIKKVKLGRGAVSATLVLFAVSVYALI